MINYDDQLIREMSKYYTSVNELGVILKCSGAGKPNYNINGRDLKNIRRIIGLRAYCRLARKSGNSKYAKIYDSVQGKNKALLSRIVKSYGDLNSVRDEMNF